MWWRVTFIAGALLAAVVPVPPALVERAYSVSAYRALQRPVTSLSNLVPFALFDALIVVALSFWIGAAAVDIARRAGWPRVIGRALLRTAVMASAVYLAFLVVWGVNYRRVRLADKLEFDETAVSQDTAVSAAATTIGQLNALYDEAHR